MELTTFILWIIIIIFTVFILVVFLLKPSHFRQKVSHHDRILWSLVIATFATLIFGLIVKPYITYNYCIPPTLLSTFFPGTSCSEISSFILWLLELVGFLLLILLLINSFTNRKTQVHE